MRSWDKLPLRVQQRLIDQNTRDAAKAARANVPKFDREKEKERSQFARRLTKWLDAGWRKLPSNEYGIAQHQAMVAEYEAAYKPLGDIDRATHDRTYASIRRQVQADIDRAADNQRNG